MHCFTNTSSDDASIFSERHGRTADEETHEAAACGDELPLVDKRLLIDLLSRQRFVMILQ